MIVARSCPHVPEPRETPLRLRQDVGSDQRQSAAGPLRVMTLLTALLSEENDIGAVFSRVAGAEGLRTVLASLDTKKQALILGHAAPLPVVIRVRADDEAFFAAMGGRDTGAGARAAALAGTGAGAGERNGAGARAGSGAAGLLEAFGLE